jgi:hypothetical protein
LRQFGAFNRLRLEPPPSLAELIALAVEDEAGIVENGLDPAEVVKVRNDRRSGDWYSILMDFSKS